MPLIRKDVARAEIDPRLDDHRRLLAEGAPGERWAAARAMTAKGDVPLLAAALVKERDPRVREALLTTLARSGVAESVDAMIPLLRSDDASARTGALDALRSMPEIVAGRLPELLRDPDADVRLLSCELARTIPAAQAIGLLSERLTRDPEPNVCAAAIDVLAELGTRDVLVALQACVARFPEEPFLAFAARTAADRIQSQTPARRG
jgi:HEAT repeat protein